MNMNEINDLFIDFDEMGFCPTTLVKNPEAYAIQWRINMREAIIKHEQDTLKEFVERLKATKKYQAWDEDTDMRGVSWGKCYTSPNHQLDEDLENFLKEREK